MPFARPFRVRGRRAFASLAAVATASAAIVALPLGPDPAQALAAPAAAAQAWNGSHVPYAAAAGSAPYMSTQPSNLSVTVRSKASLTAEVRSDRLAGAVSARLESASSANGPWSTVTASLKVTTGDGAASTTSASVSTASPGIVYYRFVFSNASGSTTSRAAKVEVRPEVKHLAGPERYATAVKVSQEARPTVPAKGVPVILATGERFPDALAAGPAAAKLGAALLTSLPNRLTSETSAEITRLKPSTIYLIGDEKALSQNVLAQAQAAAPGATIERIGGADRYETASLIATRFMPEATEAYVSSGTNYPDALAASAAGSSTVKFGSGVPRPVLLTLPNRLPDTSAATLQSLSKLRQVWVTGTKSAVSEAAYGQVDATLSSQVVVSRLGGATRMETSVLIAETVAMPNKDRAVSFATGWNFPDALAASMLGAVRGAPVLLTTGSCSTTGTQTKAQALKPATIYTIGGKAEGPALWMPEGSNAHSISPQMIGDAFRRMNEIRAEHGLPLLRTDQVRIGLGAFADLTERHLQDTAAHPDGNWDLDAHAGMLGQNEIAWKGTTDAYYDITAIAMIDGWWNSEGHRNILFQPTDASKSAFVGPDNGAFLVINFSEVTNGAKWETSFDARAGWITQTSSDNGYETAAITDVDTSLRDYVPPAVKPGAKYNASRVYETNIVELDSDRFQTYLDGGAYVAPPAPKVHQPTAAGWNGLPDGVFNNTCK